MALSLFIDNHNVLEVSGLTNTVTSTVDTGATVTVTLKTAADVEVVGMTWPQTISHVAAGLYRLQLDYDLVLTAGVAYIAYIDATGTAGEVAHWEIATTAAVRT